MERNEGHDDRNRNDRRDLSSDRRGQFDEERRGGSGGQAGFLQGGHDQTGSWQGSREEQGRRSEHYSQSGYGERRDEHGTFGSRDRPGEYLHQGGSSVTGGETNHWGEGGYGRGQQYGSGERIGDRGHADAREGWGAMGGSHEGRPFGRDDERDYRSRQYAGGQGYDAQYGRGGSYGGGSERREPSGQQGDARHGRSAGYDAAREAYGRSGGPQDYGSGPSYGGSSDWGRRHEYGEQGGYGGRHWGENRYGGSQGGGQGPRDWQQDWRQDRQQDWQRDDRSGGQHGVGSAFGSGSSQYGQGTGLRGEHFNPGAFGSGLSSGGTAGLGGGDRTFRDGGMAGDVRQGSGIGGSGYYGQGGSFGYGGGRPSGESGADLERGGQRGYGLGSGMGGIGAQSAGAQSAGTRGQPFEAPRPRGPKNYRRSDERLCELISDRLLEDPHIDSSDVSVEVKSGEVSLTGTVDDRRTKYQIEELVEQIYGVRDVDNRLKVRRGFLAPLFGSGDENSGRGERESMHYGAATDQREGSQGGAHQYGTTSRDAKQPILGPSDTAGAREQQQAASGMQTSGSGSQTGATPTTSTTSVLGTPLGGSATSGSGERSADDRTWNDRPSTERNLGEPRTNGGAGANAGSGANAAGGPSVGGTGAATSGGTTGASGVSNEPKPTGERGGKKSS